MKVSLNWLNMGRKQWQWSDDPAQDGVDALVQKIGAQLGEVEAVTQLGDKYKGIVIVKVVDCEPHPNADRLHVCRIDDGGITSDVKRDEKGLVQVVCGAPNVRAGLTVAWLPPGSTVPETYGKEPFVLEARELRGVVSHGMLASPKELGLGDSHAGILEIDGQHQPGDDFAEAFALKDEVVIDIENKMFTHRPDCFGMMGIARELAGIQGMLFKSPAWYSASALAPSEAEGSPHAGRDDTVELPLEIRNEIPELVPRFSAVTMSNIKIGPSPVWLQVALSKVGARSINNVVDLTNFYMLLTGQPLHAYDYDKVKAQDGSADQATITVRMPHKDESLKLLNGKTVTPRSEAILIASATKPIGLGGVMGGFDTEVDENTKNIILESANFDMYSIRRTSMAHGLFTDAVTRFNKGQSPLQTLPVLLKIAADVERLAGGVIAGEVIDDLHVPADTLERRSLHPPVQITPDFINDRLGLALSAKEIQILLQNVEFGVRIDDGQLQVSAPFWRTDIELREDVVEEVGRLYGYDKLPLTLPRRDTSPAPKNKLLTYKSAIRERLATAGANEVLTYSFVPGDLLRRAGQDTAQAFKISNALSPDLQYYRLSLLPSLLEKIRPNIKAGYNELALFELGKTHNIEQVDERGLPLEYEFTALVVAAHDKLKKSGAAYYQAKRYLEAVAGVDLEYRPVSEAMQSYTVTKPYDMARTAAVYIKESGEFLGIIGEFRAVVRQALKLPAYTAGFELDTQVLGKVIAQVRPYVPLPRFPEVSQDMTLQVPATVAYQTVENLLEAALRQHQPEQTRYQLEVVDIYQRPEDLDHKHLTFRLTIASFERTLTDAEVNRLLDEAAAAVGSELQAERI